jgi:signal transduction histidine kinase
MEEVNKNGIKIPFKVSARAGKLLGRENFSNPEGAIVELVKNSYDADAENCLVIFDIPVLEKENENGKKYYIPNKEDSVIYIIDNGDGMEAEIIENYWMQIGTGNKEEFFLSDKQRVKNGAKGIGRFALDRLGLKTEMWTLSKKSTEGLGHYWEMDWSQFDNLNKTISEIEADLSNVPLNIESKILEIIGNDFLNDEIKSFEFNHGTILKISNLKDEWFPNEVKGVFTTLESLIPPKELNIPFKVYFKSKQDYNLYGNVNTAFFNDFDYKIDATFDAKEQTVKFIIERNELDLKLLKKKYNELFKNLSYPFDLETIEKQKFEYSKNISKILNKEFSNEILLDVGSFHFTFNYIKFTKSLKEGYPYKDISPSERKATLERFGGIKIYRDSFRVRPYGDPKNDWLGLGFRAAKSPAGAGQRIGDWRVNNESLAGIITISRKENPNLIDKSDRGSLQENDAFELFRNIVIGIIHEFEVDRSRILNPIYLFNKKEKDKEKEIEIQKRAEELALKIIEENNSVIPVTAEKQKETYEEFFKDSFRKIIDENKEDENQEIVQIRSLASLGLIVSSFSHELKEVSNNISEIDSLEKNMMKLIPKEKYNTAEYQDIVEIFALLTDDKEKIKHWVDYTLTSIRKDKRKRTKLDFDLFFNQLKIVWSRIFKRKDIKFELINNIGGLNYDFRAFEMDMTTIFSNLINNSIDSFEERNIIDERIIQISYGITEKGFEINYFDNGKGLDKTFTNKEDIFLAFTTSKVDRHGNEIGTGLGMYLVKSVIDDNNGSIQILEPENGFGVRLLFPLNLK